MLIYVPIEVPDAEITEFLLQHDFQFSSGSVGNTSSAPRRTQRAQEPREERDPWADDANPTTGRDARPAARPSSGSRAASDEGRVVNVKTKNGVQTWRFPSDAPDCDCGDPAGLVSALGSNNKRYKAYRCAKRSGDDWRSACDFNEFTR